MTALAELLVQLTTRTALLVVSACGAPFQARPAVGFVQVVHTNELPYDFRAVAPEGMAFAVRSIDLDEPLDVAFCERAVRLRMRELDGYAFIATSNVKTGDG